MPARQWQQQSARSGRITMAAIRRVDRVSDMTAVENDVRRAAHSQVDKSDRLFLSGTGHQELIRRNLYLGCIGLPGVRKHQSQFLIHQFTGIIEFKLFHHAGSILHLDKRPAIDEAKYSTSIPQSVLMGRRKRALRRGAGGETKSPFRSLFSQRAGMDFRIETMKAWIGMLGNKNCLDFAQI
jgi:hypothetical protein